jgi:hypothetical protein
MATVSFSMSGAVPVELPLRQFDADEYMAMVEAGVFEERRRVELIGGYIIDMAHAVSTAVSRTDDRFPFMDSGHVAR